MKNTALIPQLRFSEFEDEWVSKKLGEISKFSKGRNLSKNDIIEDGLNECIRYGELYTTYNETIDAVYSRTNLKLENSILSEANDIIIPASGETQLDIATASCVLRDGIIIGSDLNILRTSNNGVFLSYYLNSKKKIEIAKLSQGSSVIHLYSSQLSLLKINLPSIKEQQKIASFLTDVDAKITQLAKKKALLEDYKKGLMQQLFNQEIRFNDEEGNEYPDWKKKKIGNIGDVVGGGTPSTTNKLYWNGGIQWFTPTEIKSDYLTNSVRTISHLGLQKSSAKLLPAGTILLTTRATIGEIGIATKECATNQGFQSIIVNDQNNNVFVSNWLKMNKFLLIKMANGSTFVEISKSEIMKLKMKVPCLEEQAKIANFLSDIDMKIKVINTQIEDTTSFKKGLLQQLFV